jgi:hypothetical protein
MSVKLANSLSTILFFLSLIVILLTKNLYLGLFPLILSMFILIWQLGGMIQNKILKFVFFGFEFLHLFFISIFFINNIFIKGI